jgi:hypothetical protein
VTRLGGRLAQCPESDDDTEPEVGAVMVALAAHLLDHLARLGDGAVAVALNPAMGLALNVEIGKRHAADCTASYRRRKRDAMSRPYSGLGGIGRKWRGLASAAMAKTLVWLLSLRSTMRA